MSGGCIFGGTFSEKKKKKKRSGAQVLRAEKKILGILVQPV